MLNLTNIINPYRHGIDHMTSELNKIRIHLTNISGTGAIQLVSSLLPALETEKSTLVKILYLPSTGFLSNYKVKNVTTKTVSYTHLTLPTN